MHYKETKYGFEWGGATFQRLASDDKKGWVIASIETRKFKDNMMVQIYVTKTGKVRIFDSRGEWTPLLVHADE